MELQSAPTGKKARKKKGDSVASAAAAKAIVEGGAAASQGPGLQVPENGANANGSGQVSEDDRSSAQPSRTQSPSIATVADPEAHMAEEELQDLHAEIDSVPIVNGKVEEDRHPALWKMHKMLVADPFIRVKVRICTPC